MAVRHREKNVNLSNPLNCLTVEQGMLPKSQWEFCLDALETNSSNRYFAFLHVRLPDSFHSPFREEIESV